MNLAFCTIVACALVSASSTLNAQSVSSTHAVRNLASPEADVQLKAQGQIIEALTGADQARRRMMLEAIKTVALGGEARKVGPRALAMLSMAVDHPRSSPDFITTFHEVYRNTSSGGMRDVAVYELVRHIKRPQAARVLREIAARPVDSFDHRSMVESMSAIGGQEVRLLARGMDANKWVREPLALMELRRLLSRPIQE